MTATPWVSIGDVAEITGVTVDQATRTRGVRAIETLTGAIESVERSDISDRDRYWLKLACAYQAAWIADHPDLYTRADVSSASQDGESAAFRNPDAHLLAPLARKALRRLSWRGLRAVVPGGGTPPRAALDVNSEAFDNALPWTPLL